MLIVAGSINACDNGAAEREPAQDREEERVRKAERDASASAIASMNARYPSLQEELEYEKNNPGCRMHPLPPLTSEPDVKGLISSVTASARATPAPPPKPCTCKRDDPLCDCL
jgi:hypothetical protein